MDDLIRQMEAMSGEELIDQFMHERPRFLFYEGPVSVQENSSFWGIRLDGVGEDGDFPEDCVFLDELFARKFYLREGRWTEPSKNHFRIIIERVDWSDE